MVIANRIRLREFDRNRLYAIQGKFLETGEIEKMRPTFVTDIVSRIAGFRVVGQGPNARVLSTRGDCPPLIVVDRMRREYINEVPAGLIGAMELYPGAESAPYPFTSTCGTIVIWTKR